MRLFRLALFAACALGTEHVAYTPQHLLLLRDRVQQLFVHGWDSYMHHGFPADEVRPVSCEPYGPQYIDPASFENDAMGNVSLTVLDNLDTLIVMAQWDQLRFVLAYLEHHQHNFFHQDRTVQVFEASIRWLGGLLLAHLALTDVRWCGRSADMCAISSTYLGFLLDMAYDLGLRLIPSYKTSTHLPLPRINLARGLDAVPPDRNKEACTAGATTPLVEFLLLLRLTGDMVFERLTNRTFWKLWHARLDLGLVPMSLDPAESRWLDVVTGIGALVDSFYEYALKGAILFGSDALWRVFSRSYQALMAHSATVAGAAGPMYFANIHTLTAARFTMWIDSLSAFWPGLQVLAGRLSDAVSTHLVYLKVWDHFDALPERWETQLLAEKHHTNRQRVDLAVSLEWYPLRPEFIESTYYLYRATRDPMYLQIGQRILSLFETRFKVACGFAGYQDVRTGQRQNRMETFVLGELLKYLYLLFDEANDSYVHSKDMAHKNWVFSTEAHPLWYTEALGNKSRELFSSRLRKRRIPTKRFAAPGLLGSMWRGFVSPHNDLQSPALMSELEMPQMDRFGPGVVAASERLETCEASPTQWATSNFLSSGYYNWSEMFLPEYIMELTLIRPEHLEAGDNVIELTEQFLDIYGSNSELTCALSPTTKETDYILGTMMRPEYYELYEVRLESERFPFAKHDMVMPYISGRMRTETLWPGRVDSHNSRITRQYVAQYNLTANEHSDGWEVLRINSINGFKLKPGSRLWTEWVRLLLSEHFKITGDGHVYILGYFVENLKVY